MNNPTTLWQNGACAVIESPDHVFLARQNGTELRVVGAAGSTNWLHYPLPLNHNLPKGTFKLNQILLRYRCDSPTALITNIVLHDAKEIIFTIAGLNLCADDWEDFKLVINQKTNVKHGLDISIGIRFDGADEDTHALEVSRVGVDIKEEKTQIVADDLRSVVY